MEEKWTKFFCNGKYTVAVFDMDDFEKVENGTVYTVEGNSGDSCRENHYTIEYYEIFGYGTPAY